MPKKKFYNTRPKYEIYFRKKGMKRWFRSGDYYWDKTSAMKDLKWFRRNKSTKYEYKLSPYKGTERR